MLENSLSWPNILETGEKFCPLQPTSKDIYLKLNFRMYVGKWYKLFPISLKLVHWKFGDKRILKAEPTFCNLIIRKWASVFTFLLNDNFLNIFCLLFWDMCPSLSCIKKDKKINGIIIYRPVPWIEMFSFFYQMSENRY